MGLKNGRQPGEHQVSDRVIPNVGSFIQLVGGVFTPHFIFFYFFPIIFISWLLVVLPTLKIFFFNLFDDGGS